MQSRSLEVTTPPATEPVTLAATKLHLRVDSDDENTLIADLIVAARERIETWLRRSLVTRTLRVTYDTLPTSRTGVYYLPRPPLIAVTGFQYYDSNGTLATLDPADYQVDNLRSPGRVAPGPGHYWPSIQSKRMNAIQITYTAGYGAADDVPMPIREALLLCVSGMYKHREDVTVDQLLETPTVRNMLWLYRNFMME